MVNPAREKLRSGDTVVSVVLPHHCPDLAEMLGYLGFDQVVIDAEHGPLTPLAATDMVRACQVAGVSSMVRGPTNAPHELLRYLDTGAQGVMVPQVRTAEAARQAVLGAKYPPEGERGLAGTRAVAYGLNAALPAATRAVNPEVMVAVLVEDRTGLANLAEICAVPGLDVVFIGPADLSAALGYPGERNHPEVRAAVDQALRTIVQLGKVAGMNCPTGEEARRYLDMGVRYIACGLTGLLGHGARDYLKALRG